MRKFIGIFSVVAAVALLLIPDTKIDVSESEGSKLVTESFDVYESLWRTHAEATADKLASGELTTDTEVWDYLAAGQAPARKAAFMALAKYEQAQFEENEGWSADLHEKILRSYVDER